MPSVLAVMQSYVRMNIFQFLELSMYLNVSCVFFVFFSVHLVVRELDGCTR